MFGSGPLDLGYANSAILIALMKLLIKNGAITKDQAAEVLDKAVNILSPSDQNKSVAAAIKLIGDYLKPRIAA